jgi:hypothetical protein
MLKELREILLNNDTFPEAGKFPDKKMRAALSRFERRFRPTRKMRVDVGTVRSFIRRHGFFELYRWYLDAFQRMGARVIFIEGADAVGKTSLIKPLSERLGAVDIENQSNSLFYELFKMPKMYRIVVADYNDNTAVGLLFYMCMNIMALEMAYKMFKKGYRYAVIESSVLRTLSARMAIPAPEDENKLLIDKRIYHLVKDRLSRDYISSVKGFRNSLFLVFLYASDGVRREQSRTDGREYLHYESNRKYTKFVEQYLRENQIVLRRLGVSLLSVLLVTQKEKEFHKIRSKMGVDEVFVRTESKSRDVRKKVRMIMDAIYAAPTEFHDPKCCWV